MSTPITRPVGADLPRGEEAVEAAAAAEVEHGLAGLQRGDRLRVAAAEAEVRRPSGTAASSSAE